MSKIVDEHCPTQGQVLEDDKKVYSCTLNQTDIANNSNKFYIMQIIKSSDTSFTHFIRYGRTGDVGMPSAKHYTDKYDAIISFEKQFKTKTGNNFDPSKPFVKKVNKYFMSKVSYDDELEKVKNQIVPMMAPKTGLDERVQNLLSLLTNVQFMQQSLVSLQIDTKKMPLGKVTFDQMNLAKGVLDKIQVIMNDVNFANMGDQLVSLSSEYYTYLPMAFGRKRPPVINTQQMISDYKDIVTELINMVVTIKITDNGGNGGVHPLDNVYSNIKTKIIPLDKSSEMYSVIEEYVRNTHGPTHNYKLELMDVFEIEREGEKEKFDAYSKGIGNDTLLFHGSSVNNWCSILSNGLLIYPQAVNKNVVISGKMFGNSIYTASCITKSFSYCRTESSNNIGCMALAQVALGKIGKRTNADYYITPESLKKEKCDSIQGIGKHTFGSFKEINGIKIPCGKLIDSKNKCSLLYDEFMVYNADQLLIKYLILVKNIK
jgi:poly [ADP-ribose] polymerase